MVHRISIRRVASRAGKVVAMPDTSTLDELLRLATLKLNLPFPATRVFIASGDELDLCDVSLVDHDDILYISCGEEFVRPPGAVVSCALGRTTTFFWATSVLGLCLLPSIRGAIIEVTAAVDPLVRTSSLILQVSRWPLSLRRVRESSRQPTWKQGAATVWMIWQRGSPRWSQICLHRPLLMLVFCNQSRRSI